MPALPRTESQKEYVAQQVSKLLLGYGFVATPYKASQKNDLVLSRGAGMVQQVFYNVATDDWAFRIPGYKGRYEWKATGSRRLTALLDDFAGRIAQ